MAASPAVVVVGGSLAGLRSAEAIRKSGFAGELMVVGAEPHMPYNRPPLSKEPLARPTDPEWLRPNRAATDIDWRLGREAIAADLAARTVTLGDGEVLSWDGLVIATGLRPRRLDLPGPMGGRHAVRTLEDANRLRADLGTATSLVIVGAGFIGCEVAALAASSGLDTHVVAPESAPIERPLGTLLGGELRRRLERLGVRFHLGTVPVEFGGTDRVRDVVLSDGHRLAADVVVEAVGSVPNVEWLAGNGLDLHDGVLVDANLRVAGRGDVVACGDIARFPNRLLDDVPRRVEHWMTAVDTARRAGQVVAANVLGTQPPPDDFAPVPSFWSHQEAIRLQSFGSPGAGAGDIRVLEGDLQGDVAVGYHRYGELVGVVLVGMAGRFMHYRRLIEGSGTPAVAGLA